MLLDECYVYLKYAGEAVSGGSFTEAKEHVVMLGSLSKTYAMTGWRAGFALGPKPIIAAMSKLQSQSTSSTAGIVQKAAIAALSGSQECVAEMRADYLKLRDRILAGLDGHSRHHLHQAGRRVLCLPQRVGVPGQTGREDSDELASRLLHEAHVVTVPGEAFGTRNTSASPTLSRTTTSTKAGQDEEIFQQSFLSS